MTCCLVSSFLSCRWISSLEFLRKCWYSVLFVFPLPLPRACEVLYYISRWTLIVRCIYSSVKRINRGQMRGWPHIGCVSATPPTLALASRCVPVVNDRFELCHLLIWKLNISDWADLGINQRGGWALAPSSYVIYIRWAKMAPATTPVEMKPGAFFLDGISTRVARHVGFTETQNSLLITSDCWFIMDIFLAIPIRCIWKKGCRVGGEGCSSCHLLWPVKHRCCGWCSELRAGLSRAELWTLAWIAVTQSNSWTNKIVCAWFSVDIC